MRRNRLIGLLTLLAFAGLLYAFTLDDGLRPGELEGGDLITHQYAQVLGRPGNAPGYPLYTMGGWLWFHAGRVLSGPDANPIPILSSYSTLWALVALALLYLLLIEVGAPWPVALLTGAFYAVTYFFWYYAVTTEQYTSSVAWTLAVVYLAFLWQRTRRDGYLFGLALLTGVGLAHQLTVLLIVPPLLWFVLGLEPGLLRRPKLLALSAGLVALPLLSYAFVYLSGARHPEWRGVGEWESTCGLVLELHLHGAGTGRVDVVAAPVPDRRIPRADPPRDDLAGADRRFRGAGAARQTPGDLPLCDAGALSPLRLGRSARQLVSGDHAVLRVAGAWAGSVGCMGVFCGAGPGRAGVGVGRADGARSSIAALHHIPGPMPATGRTIPG